MDDVLSLFCFSSLQIHFTIPQTFMDETPQSKRSVMNYSSQGESWSSLIAEPIGSSSDNVKHLYVCVSRDKKHRARECTKYITAEGDFSPFFF
jgi:hypothetical protein